MNMRVYKLTEKESKKYGDKVEYHYNTELEEESMGLKLLIKELLSEFVFTSEDISSQSDEDRINMYENLRKGLGLTASLYQVDVLAFVKRLLY